MEQFSRSGELSLEPEIFEPVKADFLSAAVDGKSTAATIREIWEEHNYLLDPHSAVGVYAAKACGNPEGIPTICMATAHPAKFGSAIRDAIGEDPPLPPALAGLADLPTRVFPLPANAPALKAFIRKELSHFSASGAGEL